MNIRRTVLCILLGALLGDGAAAQLAPAAPIASESESFLRFDYRAGPGGMHNAGVRAIHSDTRGNIWFGTHLEGVARFDRETYAYFDLPDSSHGLNRAWRVQEDNNGTLWFWAGHDVASFDGERLVHHALGDVPQVDDWTLEAGDIWFPAPNDDERGVGIFRHDGDAFSFLSVPIPEELLTSEVVGIWRGRGARVWAATWDVVIGYDGQTISVIDNELLDHTDATGYLHVKCIYEDSQNRVWIANNGIGVILVAGDIRTNFTQTHGVGRWDWRSGAKVKERQPGDALEGAPSMHRVFSLGEDADGNIWFGTAEQGAWRYDGESLRQYAEKDGLHLPHVASFSIDRSGDLLVGGAGVYKFDGVSFERVH